MNITRVSVVSLLLVPAAAMGDDAAISWSGAPTMLKGQGTIRMMSERIVLDVDQGKDPHTDADCTFVFHNFGPACSVRIGFPDRTRGADEPEFSKDDPYGKPSFQILKNFRSWVNGREVKTTVVPSQDPNLPGATYGGSWHVKVVRFGANSTVTIRDTYRQPQSGGISASGPSGIYLNQVQYIMSTGASWKGTIGSAEVLVHISPLRSAKPISSLTSENPYLFKGWDKVQQGDIFYTGFAAPKVVEGGLLFKAQNVKPTVASDVNLFWPNPPNS